MDEKVRQQIEREARHEVAAHPNRPGRHEEIVTRFVGAMLYGRVSAEPRPEDEDRPEEK